MFRLLAIDIEKFTVTTCKTQVFNSTALPKHRGS